MKSNNKSNVLHQHKIIRFGSDRIHSIRPPYWHGHPDSDTCSGSSAVPAHAVCLDCGVDDEGLHLQEAR